MAAYNRYFDEMDISDIIAILRLWLWDVFGENLLSYFNLRAWFGIG